MRVVSPLQKKPRQDGSFAGASQPKGDRRVSTTAKQPPCLSGAFSNSIGALGDHLPSKHNARRRPNRTAELPKREFGTHKAPAFSRLRSLRSCGPTFATLTLGTSGVISESEN